MPGWLRHFSTRASLSGELSGNAPRMANRPGKSRTALKAISVEPGSQPGGWITAASTPPSSMRPTASSVANEVTWRWAMLLGRPLPQRWICASTIRIRPPVWARAALSRGESLVPVPAVLVRRDDSAARRSTRRREVEEEDTLRQAVTELDRDGPLAPSVGALERVAPDDLRRATLPISRRDRDARGASLHVAIEHPPLRILGDQVIDEPAVVGVLERSVGGLLRRDRRERLAAGKTQRRLTEREAQHIVLKSLESRAGTAVQLEERIHVAPHRRRRIDGTHPGGHRVLAGHVADGVSHHVAADLDLHLLL